MDGAGLDGADRDGADRDDADRDGADRVLARLARIEALGAAKTTTDAAAAVLLGELRLLVREAEDWARAEGDARAQAAVTKLREGAEGMR